MRERAPRKYRRREPNPEASPALLDLASAERVELASRLASLYEALHAGSNPSATDDFFALIADRLAGVLGLRRVAIRLLDEDRGRTVRVASYGPPMTNLPDELGVDSSPLSLETLQPARAKVEELSERDAQTGAALNVNSLLVAPMRMGNRFVGVIVGDRNGERFLLDEGDLDLAQAMANVAALTLGSSVVRREAAVA